MKEPLWARDGGSLAASPLQGVGTSTYPPPAASGRTALTPVIRLPSSPQGASAPSRNRAASVSHRVVGRAWIFVCVCARSQLPSAAFLVVCDHHQLNPPHRARPGAGDGRWRRRLHCRRPAAARPDACRRRTAHTRPPNPSRHPVRRRGTAQVGCRSSSVAFGCPWSPPVRLGILSLTCVAWLVRAWPLDFTVGGFAFVMRLARGRTSPGQKGSTLFQWPCCGLAGGQRSPVESSPAAAPGAHLGGHQPQEG